jgi:potassium-dependent mechanosensitive channel
VTQKQSFQTWFMQSLQIVGILVVLVSVFLLAPAIAQPLPRADVVIDGEPLFRISSAGEYTAPERAEAINARLQAAVALPEPARVEIIERDRVSILLLNDRHLMTVTQGDIAPGMTADEQARTWARQIKDSVRQAQQYRTQEYLRQAALIAAGVLAIALAIHWGLGRFWQRSLRPTLHRFLPTPPEDEATANQPKAVDFLLSLLLAIVRTALWLGATLYITNLFPFSRNWSYYIANTLIASFTSPILTLGQGEYSVVNLLVLATMLVVLVVFSKTVTNALKSRLLRFPGVNRGAQEAIAVLLRYSLIFMGSLVLLQIWGLDISSLAIFASALSVGIGFGLQDIAKNFGSGLVLVFERPIQVGDFVEVGTFQGNVERIGARSTLIRTLDQISIIVPNSRFLEQEVINWSHDNPVSRIHLPVGVAYHSDIDLVRSLLLESAKGHPRVLSTPPAQVFFKGFGDSSLNFELLVWTAEPSRQVLLRSELYFRMEALLRQNEVEIPFPQRDLHVRVDNLPLELSPQLAQQLQQILERSSDSSANASEPT